MKRLILPILFCLLAGKAIQAQVSGYMGKRFTLSYNAYMAPNIAAYLNIINKPEASPLRLYTKHIFEADYVIGRRITAAFELGFMRHNAPIYYTEKYKDNPQSDYLRTSTALGEVKLNGFATGVNFKFYGLFSKNTIAPLGSYFMLSAQRLVYNLDDENGYTVSDYQKDTVKFKNVTAKNAGFMLGAGFGTRRIYYDKVCLDFAIFSSLAIVPTKEESIENAGNFVSTFALNRHALMYKIGIGGLLF